MKISLSFAVALLIAISGAASAQMLTTFYGPGSMGSSGACTNNLDFSQACNSQYVFVSPWG